MTLVRRRFIGIFFAAFWFALIAPIPNALFATIDVRAEDNGSITFLRWDTEADATSAKNLLRTGTSIAAQVKVGDSWKPAGEGVALIAQNIEGGFDPRAIAVMKSLYPAG